MSSSPRIFIPLGKAKIYDVNYVLLLLYSYEEIIGLYVSVQEATLMDELNTLQHLDRQHQDGFERKLATAVLEEVL